MLDICLGNNLFVGGYQPTVTTIITSTIPVCVIQVQRFGSKQHPTTYVATHHIKLVVNRNILLVHGHCCSNWCRTHDVWHILVDTRIAGNFREHKFSWITNKHAREKKFAIFIFATGSCLTTLPTIYHMEIVTHSVYFQRQNSSKISTLTKVCRSLTVKNCHAKGRDLFTVAASWS